MSFSHTVTSWTTLSPDRRRHAQLALVGTALSWALAASMAWIDSAARHPLYREASAGASMLAARHASNTMTEAQAAASPMEGASASR